MRRWSLLGSIKKLGYPVFTTFELSTLSGKSPSVVVQGLNNMVEDGLIIKVYRGIWAFADNGQFGHFPELFFSKSFSFKKVKRWAMSIPDPKIRDHVFKKIRQQLMLTPKHRSI